MTGMAEICKNLYISNMAKQTHPIQSFSLFGESTHLPDVLHCETIADRSVLHDWELTPHRHARLHQILLIQTGGGTAKLDGQNYPLHAGSLVNVPIGHVHAFSFQKNTKGWVTTFADEFFDEVFASGGTPDLGVIFSPAVLLPLLGLAALSLFGVWWRRRRSHV